VKNVGTLPHTYTIQDKGINEVLTPGQSANVSIDLAPGTYTFVCTFHQSSGMTGTLTVT
jgi:plastocyanin